MAYRHQTDAGVLFDSGRMFYGRLPRAIIGGTGVLLVVIFFALAGTGTLQSEPVAGMALAGAPLADRLPGLRILQDPGPRT